MLLTAASGRRSQLMNSWSQRKWMPQRSLQIPWEISYIFQNTEQLKLLHYKAQRQVKTLNQTLSDDQVFRTSFVGISITVIISQAWTEASCVIFIYFPFTSDTHGMMFSFFAILPRAGGQSEVKTPKCINQAMFFSIWVAAFIHT